MRKEKWKWKIGGGGGGDDSWSVTWLIHVVL